MYSKRISIRKMLGLLFLLLWAGSTPLAVAALPTLHNGGAAYFQLEPGPFQLTLYKRDLKKLGSHWDTNRELTAQLFSPSGERLATLKLPDAGRRGYDSAGWTPPLSGEINVEIRQPGIHILIVTVKRNSYFTSVLWGFESNADKFMIDAGGGHVDTARIEKIRLLGDRDPLEVVVQPNNEIYSFSAHHLTPGVEAIEIQSGNEDPRQLPVFGGEVSTILKADKEDRDLLSIRLGESAFAELQIEGVTTWREEQNPRLPLWTTRRSAWFDVEKTRWLVWPRYQKVFADREGRAKAEVLVRNVWKEPMEVSLAVSGGGVTEDRTLQKSLQPGEQYPLQLDLQGISGEAAVTVKASVADAPAVYATVEAVPQEAGGEALSLPFATPAFRQNNEAFGLQEDRRVGDRVLGELVDQNGREWRAGTNGVFVREGGAWRCVLGAGTPEFGMPYIAGPNTKSMLAVDRHGWVYSLFRKDNRYLLVAIGGVDGPFRSMELPESATGRVVLPPMTTTQPLRNPPALLMYKTVGPKISFWSSNNRFTVFVPKWEGDELVLESEIVLAENCLAHCVSVAEYNAPEGSDGEAPDYIAAYGTTSPPVDGRPSRDPGVPVYVRTFSRDGSRLGDPILIGHAPPKNDSHNAPSVLVDSKGYSHVILGGHNASFLYTRSESPWDIEDWLPVVKVAPDYDQTYVHAVVGKDDTLHLVSRIWRRGPHFPNDEFDTALIYQRKELTTPWTAPRVLVTPALEHYSHYYHRLTIAPSGRLYLAWTNWSTWSAYRNELPTLGPAGDSTFGYLYWISDDNGDTWKFYRGADETPDQSLGGK